MTPFFKGLFDYSYHFNQKIWNVLNENADRISEKSLKLYSHLLNAHQIWNNRINPRETTFGVWDLHPIQICKNIDTVNYKRSLTILDNFELDQIIHYTNTKGEAFNSSVRDMLFHVINHSTYHRAQIATEFKLNGIEPISTDFIIYNR